MSNFMVSDSSQTESPLSTEISQSVYSRFRWRQEWVFILKELRETLRDRRTTITLLAMPLLLYPLLGLGFRFLAYQEMAKDNPHFEIALNSEEEAAQFRDLMLIASQAYAKRSLLESDTEPLQNSSKQDGFSISQESEPDVMLNYPDVRESFQLERLVAEGQADLALRIQNLSHSSIPSEPSSVQIQIIANNKSPRSSQAIDYVSTRLAVAEKDITEKWLSSQNISIPVSVVSERIFVAQESGGSAALSLLPLILLLMTVTGGVYPAIDLTAGERERNTLETLISLPVPKIRLLLAKFVAVVTVTMLTGLMNLLAMFVTLYSLQLDTALLGQNGFTLGLAAKLFCVLSVFALFYSAVLLLLTSSARSFKEAQAYLIPLLLLSIGPGLIILLPGWTLGHGSSVVPLVNILLLSRDLLVGQASLVPAVVTMLSTVLYGLAVLALAAQIFGTDAVAVGSRSLWSDLLTRPRFVGPLPSASLVMGGLAVLFPAYFVASGLMSRGGDVSPLFRLSLSGILTVVLFLGLPWFLLRWQRISIPSALALRIPHWSYLGLSVLLGLATWPLIFEVIVVSHSLGFQSLDLSRFEEVQKLLEGWSQVPLPMILLSLAIAPGVCEEVFFRGFLFGGLRPVMSGRATVFVTAVIFGLFHFVLAGGAAPERLLPSTLIGLLLGWIRLRSDSLLPGISLHVIHNASLLTMAQYREELAGWGQGGTHEIHLPIAWITLSAVVTLGSLISMRYLLPAAQQEAKDPP